MKHNLMLLILLVGSIKLYSGAPISIVYGSNYEGFIAYKGEQDTFTFIAKKDDVLFIRMRDEQQVDSHIQLYNPNGTLIASDWSDGGLAELRNVSINTDGQYTLVAFDNNHNDLGYYGLSIHTQNLKDYETSISGFVSLENQIQKNAAIHTYQFSAQKDDVLFLEVRSQHAFFENQCILYDQDGNELFIGEKKGARTVIGPVKLPESGPYKIAVFDDGGNDKDVYGLTVQLLNRHDLIETLTCDESFTLQFNQLVERKVFKIHTDEDILHLIECKSNDVQLELSMEIYDEAGKQIYHQKQSNQLIHSMIDDSPAAGTYLVVLYDEHGNDTGSCGIQFHNIQQNACTTTISCQSLAQDIDLVHLAESQVYFIEGFAQNPVNVFLEDMGDDSEPYLRIYTKSGNLFAEHHHEEMADLSDFVFPYDDEFILVASDFSGNDIGLLSLSYDGSAMDLSLDDCQMIYDGFDPYSTATLTVESSTTNLSYAWSDGQSGASINVSPIEDTEYFVTVTNAQGCTEVLSTYVEVQDVHCGIGNNIKVEVCHVKNNGTHSQLCLSEEGVWPHLQNGVGHEECYLGACNYVSICEETLVDSDQDNQLQFGEKIHLRETKQAVSFQVYPNPSSDACTVEISPNAIIQNIQLYDLKGQLHQIIVPESQDNVYTMSLQQFGLAKGIYLLRIETDTTTETLRILYI